MQVGITFNETAVILSFPDPNGNAPAVSPAVPNGKALAVSLGVPNRGHNTKVSFAYARSERMPNGGIGRVLAVRYPSTVG